MVQRLHAAETDETVDSTYVLDVDYTTLKPLRVSLFYYVGVLYIYIYIYMGFSFDFFLDMEYIFISFSLHHKLYMAEQIALVSL